MSDGVLCLPPPLWTQVLAFAQAMTQRGAVYWAIERHAWWRSAGPYVGGKLALQHWSGHPQCVVEIDQRTDARAVFDVLNRFLRALPNDAGDPKWNAWFSARARPAAFIFSGRVAVDPLRRVWTVVNAGKASVWVQSPISDRIETLDCNTPLVSLRL